MQNGAGLRRAPPAHARFSWHLSLCQARAGGDPRAPAGADPLCGRLDSPRRARPAAASQGEAPAAAPRAPESDLPLLRRGAPQPGVLSLRPAALDGGARGAALHADAALRVAARAAAAA